MLNNPPAFLPLSLSYATLVFRKSKIKPIQDLPDEILFDFCQCLLRLTLLSSNDYHEYADEFKITKLFYSIYPTFIELHESLYFINQKINPNLIHNNRLTIEELRALNILQSILTLRPNLVTT